jgi:hypothetical protein
MKKFKKSLKVLLLALFIIPTSIIIFSACGDSNNNNSSGLLSFENIIFQSETLNYDGNEHEILIEGNLPENTNVLYQNNKATNAGIYNAKATLSLEGYKTLELNAVLTINKIDYDMTNTSWNYDSVNCFTYDGTEKEVLVQNLPQGTSVNKYENNKATNSGTYTAIVTLNYDAVNYNKPTISNLQWQIKQANITGITFNNATVEYDSLKHSIEVIGNIPTNSTVKITYNDLDVDGVSEVGSYTVKLEITNPNYKKFEKIVTLVIKSTEEKLYTTMFNNLLYFQNNLDSNKLYCYDGNSIKKVNNDRAEYFTINGNNLYYYNSSLLSKVIKCFDGTIATNLLEINGEYLTCDGTYLYYAVNNLLKTSVNGIYKIKLDGSEEQPTRLVQDKAEYLTYYNDKIYYSNVSDGRRLYSISINSNNSQKGTLLFDEKVSDIILDNGVLYFNSTKTAAGIGIASAIRKYNIASGNCIKLTTDNGSYLTKIGSFIYYINKDKITSQLFGDGIYKVSALHNDDNNFAGTKIISADDNGYSSLSSNGNYLYYYKLNDKHLYSYNLSTNNENDIMKNFVVKENENLPENYAKLAEYNGEIYYTNPLDNGCLYKYNIYTKSHYKVLSNSVSNVYFYNGFMYYSTYISVNYALWKMDLKTNESVKISSKRCDNLIFDGSTIYYIQVGSVYNNYIMKMGLNGENPTILYKDKNLWVASFEKVNDDIYFTINPKIGKKYVYKYNIATNTCVSLELRSNYITIKDNVMYYFNIETKTINLYNLTTREDKTLISNVDVNNMIIAGNYLYYSTKKSDNIGLYKFNLSTNESVKISDKCADGMLNLNGKIYYIQTAISYMNDYPNNSNGDGKLYSYNETNVEKL